MSSIVPYIDATTLTNISNLAGQNVITEDELSPQRIGRNGGFSLDGNNDFFLIPDIPLGTGDFSISCDLNHANTPVGTEYIFIKPSATGNNRFILQIKDADEFRVIFYDNAGASTNIDIPSVSMAGRSSYFFSFDRDGSVAHYVNGRLVSSTSISSASSIDLSLNSGAYQVSHTSGAFDGDIYDVRVWSSTKTAAQVLAISQGFNDTENLQLYLSDVSTFDGGWRDVSGNDRHATNNGATRIESQASRSFVGEDELVSSWAGVGAWYHTEVASNYVDVSGIYTHIGDGDFTLVSTVGTGGRARTAFRPISRPSSNGIYCTWTADTTLAVLVGADSYTFPHPYSALSSAAHVFALVGDRDGELVVYIDGIKIGRTSFAASLGDVITGDVRVGGGDYRSVKVFNRALTAAEVKTISQGQRLGFADFGATGSASYTSDFSAGVDSWLATRGTLAGNVDSVGGINDTLRFTVNTDNNSHYAHQSFFTVGKRYRVSGQFYVASTNSDIDGVAIYQGFSNEIVSFDAPATDTWIPFSEEIIASSTGSNTDLLLLFSQKNGSGIGSCLDSGGDDVVHYHSIKVEQLGQVLDLNPGGVASAKWFDQSGNNYHGTVTGATPIHQNILAADGIVSLTNLPTSSAGLAAGRVWSNSGVLTVV